MKLLKTPSIYSIILIFNISLFSGCALFQKKMKESAPEVTLKEVKLSSLDLEGANVDFTYHIRNKVNFEMTFTRLMFKLSVDGKQLFHADNKKDIQLKAKGESDFTITHRIIFTEFAESLMALFEKDKVILTLDGLAGVYIPLFKDSVEVPISASKEIPLPKLPKISFGAFKYKTASLNPFNPTASFELSFSVLNSNPFDVTVAKIQYSFTAASNSLISGQSDAVTIPSGQSSTISVPVNLKGAEIIQLVPKLRDLSSIKYNLGGSLQFMIMGKPLDVNFSVP